MARPKGSPNKQPLTFKRIQDALERTGHDPLMTQIQFAMGDDAGLKLAPGTITPSMRKSANEFLLERMHPTLKAVEMSTQDGSPVQINVINFNSLGDAMLPAQPMPLVEGQSSKEQEQRAVSPTSAPRSIESNNTNPDPLRALRMDGERPIADNMGSGTSNFGTVCPARKA